MSNMIGATVALASMGLLVLGGCATTDVGVIPSNGGNAPAASPWMPTEQEPQRNGPRDMSELPQAL
jgi:hypothetical protein